MSKPSIEEWDSLYDDFVHKFCNDHGKIRWLRSAFYDEEEKLNTILGYLKKADALLTQSRQEVIEEVLACAPKKKKVPNRTGDWKVVDYKYSFRKEINYNQAISDFIQSIKKIK